MSQRAWVFITLIILFLAIICVSERDEVIKKLNNKIAMLENNLMACNGVRK